MPEEEEEEGIGDVDLFTLTEGGSALTVNAKWLQHLQASARGPHSPGGWVYGLASRASDGKWCSVPGSIWGGWRPALLCKLRFTSTLRVLLDHRFFSRFG